MLLVLFVLSLHVSWAEAALQPAGPFITEQMIKSAKAPFDRPYPNAPNEAIKLGEQIIYRPNHGIIQGARVSAVEQDLVRLILKNPRSGPIKEWLQIRIANDPDFPRKLSMLALSHRSGRTDEADRPHNSPVRRAELLNAADNFQNSLAEAGIHFTNEEKRAYRNAIQLDGSRSDSVDEDHLSRLLRAAHQFDLLRLEYPVAESIQRLLPELSAADIQKEMLRERFYLKVTGTETYDRVFFELSSDPKKLAEVIVRAQEAASALK